MKSPEQHFVRRVLLSVVKAAQWKRPFIRWLLSHSSDRLPVNDTASSDMCSLNGRVLTADAARLGPDEIQVALVALSWLPLSKHALGPSKLKTDRLIASKARACDGRSKTPIETSRRKYA